MVQPEPVVPTPGPVEPSEEVIRPQSSTGEAESGEQRGKSPERGGEGDEGETYREGGDAYDPAQVQAIIDTFTDVLPEPEQHPASPLPETNPASTAPDFETDTLAVVTFTPGAAPQVRDNTEEQRAKLPVVTEEEDLSFSSLFPNLPEAFDKETEFMYGYQPGPLDKTSDSPNLDAEMYDYYESEMEEEEKEERERER